MMRQAQRSVLSLPNTATVATLGYGDTEDIHPRRKQPVAAMLAEEALRLVYGQEGGPRFSQVVNVSTQSRALVLQFSHTGDGLRTLDDAPLSGFAVRGKDGQWYNAEASIMDKDHVRLIAPIGVEARAAAYAWSNNPDEANLINGWGRAVSSFRVGLDE
jgi:sialate O-acetylesterase